MAKRLPVVRARSSDRLKGLCLDSLSATLEVLLPDAAAASSNDFAGFGRTVPDGDWHRPER